MTNNRKKIIERIRKIHRLAVSGVDGERDNAERMLTKLMLKHGITADELEISEVATRCLRYKGNAEKELLSHIIANVTGEKAFRMYASRGRYYVKLNTPEFIEIELRFSIYSAALKKEQEALLHAFIIRNSIFPPDSGVSFDDLSQEEQRQVKKAMALAENIDPVNIQNQLIHIPQNEKTQD